MKPPDWEGQLGRAIASAAEATFDFREHDCCRFAVACIRAQRPKANIPDNLLAYDNEDGANAILAGNDGVEGIAERVAALNGFGEVPPAFAQRGDVVLVRTGQNEPALGVVDTTGTRAAVADRHGLTFFPITDAQRAWRI